jgi:hypothetical protein
MKRSDKGYLPGGTQQGRRDKRLHGPNYADAQAAQLRQEFAPKAARYRLCGKLYPVMGVLFVLVIYAVSGGWFAVDRHFPWLMGFGGGFAIYAYWARHPSCPGCKREVLYQGKGTAPPCWCPTCGSADIDENGTMFWFRCKGCRAVLSKSPLRRHRCHHCKNCGLLVDETGL